MRICTHMFDLSIRVWMCNINADACLGRARFFVMNVTVSRFWDVPGTVISTIAMASVVSFVLDIGKYARNRMVRHWVNTTCDASAMRIAITCDICEVVSCLINSTMSPPYSFCTNRLGIMSC